MWTVGIKSGIITVLGLVVYGLVAEVVGLQYPSRGSLEYIVLALGIYSGHYYYKAANQGAMTYKEGLQLGLIVATSTGLINGLLVYLYARHKGSIFTKRLISNVQEALQQMGTDDFKIKEILQIMQQYVTPGFLLFGTLVSTALLGFLFTLAIAAFSKNPKENSST